MAACLLVVIATGLVTAVAGFSMAVGALIGGLLLAGTEYRRQFEVMIEPFKGLAVGVFLISIGMSLDVRILIAQPLMVLGIAEGVVIVKLLVIASLSRAFGLNWGNTRADLFGCPTLSSGAVRRLVSVQLAFGSLRPLALSA